MGTRKNRLDDSGQPVGINHAPDITCEVYLCLIKRSERRWNTRENMAFFVFTREDGTEYIVRQTLSSSTSMNIPIEQQKKLLTKVFDGYIVSKIIRDMSRELFFNFHFPKKDLKDAMAERMAVMKYIKEKNEDLRSRTRR